VRAPGAARIAAFLSLPWLALAGWLGLSAVPDPAGASPSEPSVPEPTGFVVDAAGLLEEGTEARLTAICREVREKTGAEIAAAVVPSIAPRTVDEYAVRLFERWGVGSREKDDGVLVVVAVEERQVRIEVGYGLEGILPDGRVGGILRTAVVPHLRHDDWDAGVEGAVIALARVIAEDRGVTLTSLEGVEVGAPEPAPERGERVGNFLFLFVLVVILWIVIAIAAGRGRRRGRRRSALWPWLLGGGSWGGFGGGFGGGSFGGGGGFGGFGGGASGGGGASSGF
jgi:uncharacterized protein